MDSQILEALDFERFKIRMLCVEGSGIKLVKLLKDKGYVHFMSTFENQIFILKSEFEKYNSKI